MSNDVPVRVIGGGLAGLVAAITVAEAGVPVVLHEAGPRLGGRAASGDGPYGVNLGPHVVYEGGALTTFLRQRGLHREVVLHWPRPWPLRIVDEHGPRNPARWLTTFGALQLPLEAPADVDFESWAVSRFGQRIGTRIRHLSGLPTFHHDPGSLSADFVWRACRRSLGRAHTVRYVGGGWSALVGTLERAARARGVRIELSSPVDALPDDAVTILAVPPRVAGPLLGNEVAWPMARTALLDVALHGASRLRSLVMDVAADLRGCVMAERFTAMDRSLAPPGVHLVQTQLGVPASATLEAAVARMERTLDQLGEWRPHEVWRRSMIVEGASSPADPVGTTWRDRPAVARGEGRYLAGDAVAAPGVLSEVSVNSGVRAAHLAIAERRRRRWAPGWPSVDVDAAMRARVLAAVLPGATIRTATSAAPIDEAWSVEPVAESEPYRTRTTRRGTARITAAEPDPAGGTTVTTVSVPRRLRR